MNIIYDNNIIYIYVYICCIINITSITKLIIFVTEKCLWRSTKKYKLRNAFHTYTQTRKTATTKGVWETGVSRHHVGPLRVPWNPSDHHSTIVLRSLRRISIEPPLCRDTPASRTANVTYFQSGLEKYTWLINQLNKSI